MRKYNVCSVGPKEVCANSTVGIATPRFAEDHSHYTTPSYEHLNNIVLGQGSSPQLDTLVLET